MAFFPESAKVIFGSVVGQFESYRFVLRWGLFSYMVFKRAHYLQEGTGQGGTCPERLESLLEPATFHIVKTVQIFLTVHGEFLIEIKSTGYFS